MNSVGGAGGDGSPALEMHSIPPNHTLKNGYDDRSYVYFTTVKIWSYFTTIKIWRTTETLESEE